jgi:hypothetical protein
MSWVECVVDTDYEIFSDFPYDICRRGSLYILAESMYGGYPHVKLNQKIHTKHSIVMKQFKPHEPTEEKVQIDHINHDRADYHLSNMRWCTGKQNMKNKIGYGGYLYEYVPEIPEDSIRVEDYSGYQLSDIYFHEDTFFEYNGISYRKLRINITKHGSSLVQIMTEDGKYIRMFYIVFKETYNMI